MCLSIRTCRRDEHSSKNWMANLQKQIFPVPFRLSSWMNEPILCIWQLHLHFLFPYLFQEINKCVKTTNNGRWRKHNSTMPALSSQLHDHENIEEALWNKAWPWKRWWAGAIHSQVTEEGLQTMWQISGQSLGSQEHMQGPEEDRRSNDKWWKCKPESNQGIVVV